MAPDALLVALHLATIRTYFALLAVDHRFQWNAAERFEPTRALAALGTLVPGALATRPANDAQAAKLQDDVTARFGESVRRDALADLAFGLGLAFVDAMMAARTRHLLALAVRDDPRPRFAQRLAELEPRLASARESLALAALRLAESLDPSLVSPAVGEAAEALERQNLATEAEDGRWADRMDFALGALRRAFTFPVERAARAPASPEETALLLEIAENPDDDAPRLAWAALASARGELRSELVREQVTARAEGRIRRAWLGEPASCTYLLTRHGEAWSSDVRRLGADEYGFHGGFVEAITITAEAFLQNAAALFRAAPIRRVRLTEVATRGEALLASGWLDRLLWLDVSDQHLGDAFVLRLVRHLRDHGVTTLRALSLEGNGITDAGVRALWACEELRSLEYCGLGGNPCSPLAEMEMTPQEMSVHEWVPTAHAAALEATLGWRGWALPTMDEWPPHLEMLAIGAP